MENEALLRYTIIEIEMKQIIIVNDALALPRGKLAAQVAHASLASFLSANPLQQKDWLDSGMPKIVLSAESEQQIMEYYRQAKDHGLPAELVKDAGKTVVQAGAITCLGIGPSKRNDIDRITGHLKLVK